MLYYLYNLKEHFVLFNLLRYITFRSAYAALTSLLITFLFGKWFIAYMRRKNFGERISKYLNDTHGEKEGTPSMGGVIMLVSLVISTLLWAIPSNRFIKYLLFMAIYMGLLGMIDDVVKMKRGDGIRPITKLAGQIVPCLIIGILLIIHPVREGYSTMTSLLFLKNTFLNLGYLYLPFIMLVVIGTTNAVNLTDGLDGLAIGLSGIIAGAFIVISYFAGHSKIANYLNILYIDGAGEIAVFLSAFLGSAIGFLWFNTHPAEIFMGDTGSLMIGGILGLASVLIKQELVFFIVSGVFVIETLSVIIQVGSFKMRGKRVFLMAPIHHHFQKLGWPETKVVVRFWIMGIMFALLGISTLKIR